MSSSSFLICHCQVDERIKGKSSEKKNPKTELQDDLAVPLLDIYPKSTKTIQEEHLYAYVYCCVFILAKIWKFLECLRSYNWIKKVWYRYTLAIFEHKKKMKSCSLPLCGWFWRVSC